MRNMYTEVSISFELLQKVSLPDSAIPFILSVSKDNKTYEFLIKYKNSNKLLVMGNGAYDKKNQNLPLFQRHSWINDIDSSIIYYNDPTLYLGDISIGWCCGDKNNHYLLDIADIIKIISHKFNIYSNNILFYGSSAGGFTSLMLSTLFKDSTALVNNPQTSIPDFSNNHFKLLCNVSFPDMPVEEVLKQFQERFFVYSFMIKHQNIPKIKYLQNIYCKHDMDTQCLPFINKLKNSKDIEFAPNSFELHLYFNKLLGHNPLDKDKSIFYINNTLKEISR